MKADTASMSLGGRGGGGEGRDQRCRRAGRRGRILTRNCGGGGKDVYDEMELTDF